MAKRVNKKALSERNICTKFITPALRKAGWDEMLQTREEVSFTKGRNADQQDAYSVAAWLGQADANGELEKFLNPSLTPEQRVVAEVEGWILGVV